MFEFTWRMFVCMYVHYVLSTNMRMCVCMYSVTECVNVYLHACMYLRTIEWINIWKHTYRGTRDNCGTFPPRCTQLPRIILLASFSDWGVGLKCKKTIPFSSVCFRCRLCARTILLLINIHVYCMDVQLYEWIDEYMHIYVCMYVCMYVCIHGYI